MKTSNFYPGDSDIMLTATKKGYNYKFCYVFYRNRDQRDDCAKQISEHKHCSP